MYNVFVGTLKLGQLQFLISKLAQQPLLPKGYQLLDPRLNLTYLPKHLTCAY